MCKKSVFIFAEAGEKALMQTGGNKSRALPHMTQCRGNCSSHNIIINYPAKLLFTVTQNKRKRKNIVSWQTSNYPMRR